MPPRPSATLPVVYPRLGFTVCGSPTKTGVSPELAAQIRAALSTIGCEDLLNYVPPMTYLDAITLIGAEWETPENPFGDDYLFLDRHGVKVRCTKNPHNRPLNMGTVEARVQDILNSRWELNGETGIVGRDATILDFQHTCVALIFAWQDWVSVLDHATQDRVWVKQWPVDQFPYGPTVEKCIVYGIENTDRVVNTINTGRPRSLSDVLYRCPYFASLPKKSADHVDRVTAAKVTADAIRIVWHRTGMYNVRGAEIATHAEACSWLENHGGVKSKLLEAVRVILDANKEGQISAHVRLGYAAGMLYLMGASSTEDSRVGKYYADDVRTGKRLQWDAWDRAVEFWTAFGSTKEEGGDEVVPTGKLAALTQVLLQESKLEESADSGPRNAQRDYAVVGAWRVFRTNGKKVEEESCKPVYTRAGKSGFKSLKWTAEEKSVGGVDLGQDRLEFEDPEVSDVQRREPDPRTAAEVENSKSAVSAQVDQEYQEQVKITDVTTAAANGTEDLLSLVRETHTDFGCVLLKTPKGDYAAWGDREIGVVEPYITKKARMHPKGLKCVTFRPDEVETLTEHLCDAGIVVGLVSEVVSAGDGEERFTVESVYRPGKEKS